MKTPNGVTICRLRGLVGLILLMALHRGSAVSSNQTATNTAGYAVPAVPPIYSQAMIQQLQYPQISVYSGGVGHTGGSYYYSPLPSTLTTAPTASYYSEADKDELLEGALKAAWEQYGPKSKPASATGVASSKYSHRDTSGYDTYVGQMSGFQPSGSEWDQHVTQVPVAIQPPPVRPDFISKFMDSYIRFEVNYHEVADFIRRSVFYGIIGLLVVGWIALGLWIGLLPLKIFSAAGRKREVEDTQGNSLMSEIKDRVMLALDQDWLHKLQERIQNSDNARSWSHVQCCLLPDSQARGMTDCHPVRRGSKDSTWKCLSDLMYNIQFGPPEPERRADKKKQKQTEAKSGISES